MKSSSVTPGAEEKRKKRKRDDNEVEDVEYESMKAHAHKEKEKYKEKVEKYKEMLARNKKVTSELEKQATEERDEWAEKELRYQRKIKVMAKDMETRKMFHWRNQLKTQDRDTYDNANRVTIRNFLRCQIIPHHKFPHSSLRNWTSDDPLSYSGRLSSELCFPGDVVERVFYDDKIVPELNKCMIE